MDINQIVKEVQSVNPAATEESVLQSLVDMGLEASDISKSEIPSIANRIQGAIVPTPQNSRSSSIQPTQPNANRLSTGTPRPIVKRPVDQQSSGTSLGQVVDQTVGSFESAIEVGLNDLEDGYADRLTARLADSPNRIIQKFNDRAGQLEADPETFRQLGQQFVEGFAISMRSRS